MKKLLPLVSVVITTKDEEKNIENCLISIRKQTYENIEIIVVDNNSSDKTKQISKKYTKNVYNKGPERSAQRNYAVFMSSGEYFLQLDADQILKKRVVEECVNKVNEFKNSSVSRSYKDVALHIPEVIIGGSFLNKVRNYEKGFYNNTVIDCSRFISKKIFEKVGGYDLRMTGPEDWDLDNKIRKLCFISTINEPFLHNEEDISLIKLIKKKNYYANGMNLFLDKWKNNQYTKKRLGFYYRYFLVFIENKKWKKIFKNPLLFLVMYSIRILIGFIFFINKLR
ncbi:glycosyltransferase [Methylophilaceae bacterium Uisw_099_01]